MDEQDPPKASDRFSSTMHTNCKAKKLAQKLMQNLPYNIWHLGIDILLYLARTLLLLTASAYILTLGYSLGTHCTHVSERAHHFGVFSTIVQ